MAADTHDRRKRALRIVVGAILALALALLGIDAALATSDTTFTGPLDTVTGMVSGTGGQLAAALAVGAALVGSVLPLQRDAAARRRRRRRGGGRRDRHRHRPGRHGDRLRVR